MKPSRFATFPQGILHPVVCDYISIIGVLKLVILNSTVASSIFMMVVHISMTHVFFHRVVFMFWEYFTDAQILELVEGRMFDGSIQSIMNFVYCIY